MEDKIGRFEHAVFPHLDAAFNLARWLTRDVHDGEDLVQEACLRALKSFAGFRGRNAGPWLLTIVRNTCHTWMQLRSRELITVFDEELHGREADESNPETLTMHRAHGADVKQLTKALEELPVEYREALVLRELEDLSYKQIADVADAPMGTVMCDWRAPASGFSKV